MALPCTITCAPVSLLGFNKIGLKSTRGAILAAIACNACARPISPPSSVTALFSAIFCGLNGATLKPRLTKTRQSPATTVLLPASEVVPCIIRVFIFAPLT